MNDVYTIVPNRHEDSVAVISRHLAGLVGFDRKKRGYVCFGTQKFYVDFIISDKVADNEVHLSRDAMESLHIPEYINYEIRGGGSGLIIGPCIGVLISAKLREMTSERLEHIKDYIGDYSKLHGAVIVFGVDGVDTGAKLIKGFCYNPRSKSWQAGVFPYPLGIYRTASLSSKWQNHFLSIIGDSIFNSRYFSKWEMYKWFSTDPKISPHIPYTALYKESSDIFKTLEKYGEVYIKPNWGMKGHGVVKATLKDDKIIFQYRKDKKNITVAAEGREEWEKAIRTLFGHGEFIVQQGIDLLSSQGGVADFRVVMQKNETGDWSCVIIVARVGAKESVVSNISSGGRGQQASDLLKELLSLSSEDAYVFVKKMNRFCYRVSKTLDRFGVNCGTLGIDLGVDKRGKIWLIEINHRSPHPAIALLIKDNEAYDTIISNPLRYAKYLAGFGE